MSTVGNWYESSYRNLGTNAQRKYPNEELSRFVGRRFSHLSNAEKSSLQVLEVGCGSGANLRMLAEEKFNVMGLDISSKGVDIANTFLSSLGLKVRFIVADMCNMSQHVENHTLDVVVDIFSSNCLSHVEYLKFLNEVHRILKPGGTFFSYTPSKRSDAYINPGPSSFIDSYTLNGISRCDSPFTGNLYPFRFMHPNEVETIFKDASFSIEYLETVGRTYRRGVEYFEFIVTEAIAEK